jgi:putative oxidoreductase
MEKFLGKYSSYIYAILRIVAGFLFMQHGTQKLLGFPPSGKPPMPLNGLMMTAGVIELVAGLLILIGLFASIAAFIASGMMAVAYFTAHQPGGALPIQNGGELAALYSFLFLYIAAVGSGTLSVDSILGKGKS